MKLNGLIAFALALVLVCGLAACSGKPPVTESTPPASSVPSSQPTATPSQGAVPTPVSSATPSSPSGEKTTVNLAVLSGPTGVGAAKLLSDADNGVSVNDYHYTIGTENSELVAGLTNGDFDIATVASNVAANLYNKTEGGVKIIALGTLGVLHILESGGNNSINSVSDLFGKTIYSPGQGANPEYILRYILRQYGIDPDNDVNLVFGEATEITQKLMTGEAEVAMLPVPAATAAIIKGEGKIRAAIDVTEAWNSLDNGSALIMTAVVARAEFIESNPDAVNAFLAEYAASIDYVNNNVDEAAQLIAGYGITPNAAIAKNAIPQCHLVCITGKDMAPTISDYFMTLFEVNPSAIGGFVPDDGIYYVP